MQAFTAQGRPYSLHGSGACLAASAGANSKGSDPDGLSCGALQERRQSSSSACSQCCRARLAMTSACESCMRSPCSQFRHVSKGTEL